MLSLLWLGSGLWGEFGYRCYNGKSSGAMKWNSLEAEVRKGKVSLVGIIGYLLMFFLISFAAMCFGPIWIGFMWLGKQLRGDGKWRDRGLQE